VTLTWFDVGAGASCPLLNGDFGLYAYPMKSTKVRSSGYTVKGTSVQALPVTQAFRRSAATPNSFVDPDNFQSAVQVLHQARSQLLDAADRADFASSKAGTPMRTQEVRCKIDELTAEIRRIEQQILRAASTEFGPCGTGAQDFLRKSAGIRRGRQVELGLDEELATTEFGLRRSAGNRRSLDGLNDRFVHRSWICALRDNLRWSRGFNQDGIDLWSTALRFGPSATKKDSKIPTTLKPKSTDDLAAMTDEQLARLSREELDQSIRMLLNVKSDASMSDKELKLALRLAGVVDPKNPELHLAALAAENINTLRALAEHVGFANDLRDIAKSMTDAQLKALSTKDLTGLIGVLARAGDDLEMTKDDLEQIQRVLSAFNNSERSPASALALVETAIGADPLKVLAFASVKLDGRDFNELALGGELRRLVGSASFAPNFCTSGLATLIRSGDREVAGFLFKSGVTYSLEMLNLGFQRFVINKESFDEELQKFLILEPPGLRVLDALGNNPSAASSILFAGKSADQAWLDYKKWLDGPDRLSKRRTWNVNAPKDSEWSARDVADKATDMIAALFLRAATHGYATQHAGPGEGQFLFEIFKHAFAEQGKYKLTDGGRVALAALVNDTMAHKEYTLKFILELSEDRRAGGLGLGFQLLDFITVLSESRLAGEEIVSGFGVLLNRIDIVRPLADYQNARDAGEAFARIVGAINDGLKARSDKDRARAEKYALVATILVSLGTGGLGAGFEATGAVGMAGIGDGLMSYISGMPKDTFEEMKINALVTFMLQIRILESATPGIGELRADSLVARYLNPDKTIRQPKIDEFDAMMVDINGAFTKRDPDDEQSLMYPGPREVLQKALSGWESSPKR
jgi:hypothetical protein